MKINYLPIIALLLLFSFKGNSQTKPGSSKGIVDVRGLATYYQLKDLEAMNKGELKEHYKERLKILVGVIPYFGITTKVGVTMKDLGIPETPENVKTFEKERTNKDLYLASQVEFLDNFLTFSDKADIIKAIILYQDFLKTIYSGVGQ